MDSLTSLKSKLLSAHTKRIRVISKESLENIFWIFSLLYLLQNFIKVLEFPLADLPADPQAFLAFTNQIVKNGYSGLENVSISAGDKTIIYPAIVAAVSKIIGVSGTTAFISINGLILTIGTVACIRKLKKNDKHFVTLILYILVILTSTNFTYGMLYFYEGIQIVLFLASLALLESDRKIHKYALYLILVIEFLIKWQSFLIYFGPILIIKFYNKYKKNLTQEILVASIHILGWMVLINSVFNTFYNLKVSYILANNKNSSIWTYGNNGIELGIENVFEFRLINLVQTILLSQKGLAMLITVCLYWYISRKIRISICNSILFTSLAFGIVAQCIIVSWDPRQAVLPGIALFAICREVINE
jgi:hypothetical protein